MAGPATETTLQAILTAIGGGGIGVNANITGPLGQAAMTASIPVVVANDQTAMPVSSATLATEATLSTLNGKVTACDTGNVTVASSALPTGASTEATLAAMSAKLAALGQAAMAASHPVVIANDQTAIPVTVGSIALPTGAATELTLSALNGKVTACDTGNIAGTVTANLGTIAGVATEATLSALNGKVTACNTGAVVVTTLPSIPAGANNIGDVDVLTMPAITGTVTANLGTIAGVATEATLSAINGKITACNTGAVTVSSSVLPTGAATEATLSALSAKIPALGQALMAASQPVVIASNQSAVPVSGTITANLGTIADVATQTTLSALNAKVTACNTGAVTISAALPAGNNNIGDMDVVSIVPGTGATNLGKAEDAAHSSGDVGVMSLGVANTSHTARAANGDYIPIATDLEGCVLVTSGVAHDAADADNPVKIGFVATTNNNAAVANGDRVNALADDKGRQVTILNQVRDLVTQANITLSNTTETTLLAAGGAGVFNDCTKLVMTNSATVGTRVDFRDATGGTVRMSVYLAPNGGGAVIPFDVPMNQTTANAVWTAQLSATPTGGDVRIYSQFVINT